MQRNRVLLLITALLLALAPASARAAEPRTGDAVVVGPNETIADDLYAFGQTVHIQGTVKGDVFAAARTVTVSGAVTGNLNAAGATVVVTGEVGGSVRAAGESVTVDAPVGGDVLAAANTLLLGPNARVGRDLWAEASTATLNGPIGRNMRGGFSNLTINGAVAGDVRVEAEALQLTDRAAISGDLAYTSEQEATVDRGAAVRGRTERQQPEGAGTEQGPAATAGQLVLDWLRTLVGMFALGVLFVLLLPGFSRQTMDALRRSPLASLGLGCALIAGVPIAALVVFVVGLIVGGWWLAFVVLSIYGIALALSFAAVGLFVGRWILERTGRPELHIIWALLVGLVLLTLVGLVPVLGGLVVLAAMLFGLGALTLAAVRARQAQYA